MRLRFFFILLLNSFLFNSLSIGKIKDLQTCQNFNFNNSDFNLNNFLSSWLPLVKSKEIPFFSECDSIKFVINDGSVKAEVKNKKNPNSSSNMNLKFSETKNTNSFSFSYLGIKNILTVLDTDYTNFAVLYTCTDLFFSKLYNIVILSKSDELPDSKLKEIKENIEKKTGKTNWINVNQKNC